MACAAWGLPACLDEYHAIEGRRFRLDLAFPKFKVGIELQGGIWTRGAHGRGTGITRDYEKSNLHQANGWIYLQFTPTEFYRGDATDTIKAALKRRGWKE